MALDTFLLQAKSIPTRSFTSLAKCLEKLPTFLQMLFIELKTLRLEQVTSGI